MPDQKYLVEIPMDESVFSFWHNFTMFNYMKEVGSVAYFQFLESYKNVTMDVMAKSFGVSIPFLDSKLSRFIAASKLNCKIDKVIGILETNHPDAKNVLYQSIIKQGDFLFNRIQKLSKVIDI
jgi:26S proteasome regulatory subunit N7